MLWLTGVLAWFWWPAWRGRVSFGGGSASPSCLVCGYCLVGNVTGVCPECGSPIVVPRETVQADDGDAF